MLSDLSWDRTGNTEEETSCLRRVWGCHTCDLNAGKLSEILFNI